MGPGPLLQFLPLVMVMVICYFLLIRPQQQKLKAHRQLIDNLKRNDEVMTGGGLYGRVVELADRIVTLEIAPNVRVRVDRLHVETVVSVPKPGKSTFMPKRPVITVSGSIVTLTYLGSDRVFQNYNVMGVAKAALESTVRYLAADLGPKNIRVNAISAGPIKTLAAKGISGFSNILQIYRDRAPLRRTVDTAEVADAALFLLSDAGRAVTAEVLMVDGGYHATGM